MARKRSIVLTRVGSTGQVEPLGSLREVAAALGNCNISPDGSGPYGMGERMGTGVFHGPGMIAEIPIVDDAAMGRGDGPEVSQVLVWMTDEDFAFPVLMRLCKQSGWKMMDPESGRTFG